jgi:hypothetical protein
MPSRITQRAESLVPVVPPDVRERRLVLPDCAFCGSIHTSVVSFTEHFIFLRCPQCPFLFSIAKPRPETAGT